LIHVKKKLVATTRGDAVTNVSAGIEVTGTIMYTICGIVVTQGVEHEGE